MRTTSSDGVVPRCCKRRCLNITQAFTTLHCSMRSVGQTVDEPQDRGSARNRIPSTMPAVQAMRPSGPDRLYELDLMRLVAAVMVILYHYMFRLHARDDLSPVQYPVAIEGVTRYGFLGVQLFFLISGAVILRSASGRTARSFLKSRATRLFPAYWVMLTITFLACRLWGFGAIGNPSAKNYIGNLTMLQTFYGGDLIDGVYWTLARELVFYAIIMAVIVAHQISNIRYILAGWLLLSVAAEVLSHPFDTRVFLATDYAAFFIGGATCAQLAQENRPGKRHFLWMLFFTSMATAVWSTLGREARRIGSEAIG